MPLHSKIQTVPFYIPSEETKRLKRFKNIFYTSIWLYRLRLIVLEKLFFISQISTLVRFVFHGGIEEIMST